jgi:molecular chaperone GrpE (heat shock protein)
LPAEPSFAVSADADTLRLERENSSLLDEQVILEHDCISPQPNTERKVARETMLALLDPSDAEAFSTSAAAAKAATSPDKCHSWPAQAQSVYDEFGNDEIQLLRQTVSDLQQQVSMLQSELQKYRRRKAGK